MKITDIKYVLKQKWKWARHIAGTKDILGTGRGRERQPKRGKHQEDGQADGGWMTS